MAHTPKNTSPSEKKDAAYSHGILAKFLHLAGAQWLRDGLHTVFLIYLARQSTSDYGEFMVAFGLASIILFLGEFGLNQPLVASLSKKFTHKGDILAQYTLLKGGILTAGWLGVLIFVLWQDYTPGLTNLVLVISAGVGLEALASSFFVAIRVEGRQDLEARIRAVAALLGYGWGLSLLIAGAAPHWIALFKLIENGVNLAGGIWMALAKTDFEGLTLKRKSLARTWATAKNGAIFVLMALAAILYNKANVYFLQGQAGPTKVAQYSATWELVDGMAILVSNLLLRSVLYPLFVRLWKNDRQEFGRLASDCLRWLIGISLPVMFVLYVESDRIIGAIYGGAYHEAMWMQKYLVFTIICAFVHNLAAYLMMSQGRERLLLFIYVAGLAVNLVLCATLIPADPLLGACLAMLVTKAAVALASTAYCHFSMHIINLRALAPIGLALAAGCGLYLLLGLTGVRELAEAAALIPFVFLVRKWRAEIKARQAAVP
ncbi:oligosaccharide flippase family protein [Desulfovibrio sulfodismutans]|uniref:Oligosaccharide flippase family protein n=1 Tax=Desulfolutivibrio sulfodismutans TaxID=63561 RepID=A0A7K3NJV4_9BACT|nr:oligosaccharide flippase family protein [Desulfolutivibrio sulfodismutans]NDY56073.1 oligosaccharide flippase family protein [Desulfolutivibrio sulfodismutans]QLA12328.1 oligosaccharide flippase family protein [Desulfolutivibrio sulfodismutans DSM 3696]